MHPLLIIGGGLAGIALAWRLQERGVPFLIVDRDEPLTSSKVAAGLVTPITGLRLTLNWRFEIFYPEALSFYRGIEQRLGATFYQERPIVSLFVDEKAAALWSRRVHQPEMQPYLAPRTDTPLVNEALFANPHGGFVQQQAGWLDTAAYLHASRAYFHQLGPWHTGEVAADAVQADEAGITWQGQRFSHAIFCTGWQAAQHPWFTWVPFQSARGTVLSLQADLADEQRILNRGCWLLPQSTGTFRAGSTYEWAFDDPHTPSPEAMAGLEGKLRALLKPHYTLLGSQTAVRPIIKGRQALLGTHPARPRIAFLGGLGSKGVLRAPSLAQQLVTHLLDGTPIDPELDLAGNF